ncbi:hypothetical protein [Saccharicrinis aurantiacus]|uniref:hypothetical protein n=1 Tax=Saccharicrinis aurantiacus TaxID=1849719 RepID=UPI00094FCCA1|nr:hypothetical protein [Saccharicrinis aurantiacus]
MNTALIEFNGFHDECLHSQVDFLKTSKKNKVFLICNYRLKDRINYWDKIDDVLFLGSNQWGIGYIKIVQFLRKHNISRCVFNSIHHPSAKRLLNIASSKRKYFGIVHDRNELLRKNNRKVNGYLFLNDYLLNGIDSFVKPNVKTNSYYPIFFQDSRLLNIKKASEEIWIAIPGKMQQNRRDYNTLLHSFKNGTLNKNIKLIFLGQSIFKNDHGQDIRKEFEKYDANNNCIFWDKYINPNTFDTYMKMSDFVLPLIHTDHSTSKTYQDKISGSFNLAFGFNKPLIMDSFFKQFNDFRDNGLFYNCEGDLVSQINKLVESKPDNLYKDTKWTYKYQCKNYLEFIE